MPCFSSSGWAIGQSSSKSNSQSQWQPTSQPLVGPLCSTVRCAIRRVSQSPPKYLVKRPLSKKKRKDNFEPVDRSIHSYIFHEACSYHFSFPHRHRNICHLHKLAGTNPNCCWRVRLSFGSRPERRVVYTMRSWSDRSLAPNASCLASKQKGDVCTVQKANFKARPYELILGFFCK